MLRQIKHVRGLQSDILTYLSHHLDDGGRLLVKLPYKTYLFSENVEDYKEILIKRYQDFDKGHSLKLMRFVLGQGLVTADHPQWKADRKILNPNFTRPNIALLRPAMERLVGRWIDECISDRTELDVFIAFGQLSLAIALNSFLGIEPANFENPFYHQIEHIQHRVIRAAKGITFPLWIPTPHHLAIKRQSFDIRKMMKEMLALAIQEHPKQTSGASYKFPHLQLLRAQTDGLLSQEQVMDEITTLILAGHETVSTTLTWTLILLLKHPEQLALARENEAYLICCIKESMRLFPAAWSLTRANQRPEKFGDHALAKNAEIVLSTFHTQRSPRYWKEGEVFKPERFLDQQAVEQWEKQLMYAPFGAGPRSCIGYEMAMIEMVATLQVLLQEFDVELIAPENLKPVPLFTLTPNSNRQVRLKPRKYDLRGKERTYNTPSPLIS